MKLYINWVWYIVNWLRSKSIKCYQIEWDNRLIDWDFGLFEWDKRILDWCPDLFIEIWINLVSSKIDSLRSIYISINQFKIYFNQSRSRSIYLDLNQSIWSQSINLDSNQCYCRSLKQYMISLNQLIDDITQSIDDLN